MIQWQILKDGNPIDMDTLDAEAAAFFGVKVDDLDYASPKGHGIFNNWYEIIGYAIGTLPHKENQQSWSSVVANILKYSVNCVNSFEDVEKRVKFLQPYIELCFHWRDKGYVPLPC